MCALISPTDKGPSIKTDDPRRSAQEGVVRASLCGGGCHALPGRAALASPLHRGADRAAVDTPRRSYEGGGAGRRTARWTGVRRKKLMTERRSRVLRVHTGRRGAAAEEHE